MRLYILCSRCGLSLVPPDYWNHLGPICRIARRLENPEPYVMKALERGHGATPTAAP